jgi:nitrite reductase (NO-forming)
MSSVTLHPLSREKRSPSNSPSITQGFISITAAPFNATPFEYDPVHDTNATQTLEAKPGERVRIYFVNAGPNEFSGFHPIAGIWDKVYPSGNPKNVMTAMQNYTVAPGDAAIFDIISPKEGAKALVNHSMRAALSGAIAVLMISKDADPSMGHGDKILVR